MLDAVLDHLDEFEELLNPEQQARLAAIMSAPEPIWSPDPRNKPQTLAYHSKADIVGFGGAAGGGKTDLSIGKALTNHQRTLILRRVSPELMAIVDRISGLLGGREAYSGKDAVFRLSETRQIELGSIPNVGNAIDGFQDEKKYQGRPHDLLVFDEATNFPRATVEFLSGWVRSEDPDQHCQMLLTFNPPMDAEGRWVIDFFAPWLDPKHPDPAKPGELRWYARDPKNGKEFEVLDGEPFMLDGELVKPKSRTFIPSRVQDNSYYASSGYIATLQALPEPLRSRLLRGDFLAGIEADPMQVIPTAWIEMAQERWVERSPKPPMDSMGVDVARGGKDNTVIARRHEGLWFDRPIKVPGRETPTGQAVANLVGLHQRDKAPIHLDVIGVGASPFDIMRAARFQIQGVNVSERATSADRTGRLMFANQRAQLCWAMRDLLDPQADTGIALPPDPELLADLAAYRWFMRGALVAVESRDEIIKRIGRSPDVGTAYILATLSTPRYGDLAPGVPAQRSAHNPIDALYDAMQAGAGSARSRRDYDPYGD